jgi:tetratricopeptide (TPR) repeat protein
MARQSPGAIRLLALNGAIGRDAAAKTAIDSAWGLRYSDPKEMLVWARLAVELAESPQVCSRSHAHLGNALRITGQFGAARHHLEIAGRLQDHPDALLLEFRASLLEDVGGFADALSCLRTAGRLRAEEGDVEGEAKVLSMKGHVLNEAGHHTEAAKAFRAALEKVQADPDVARAATHGLVHSLAKSGEPFRALAVLREGQPLLELGDTLFQFRVTWLLGRIAMVCGDDSLAITNLEAAHQGFAEKQLLFETCLTALDLALHHTRCDRPITAHQILDPVPDLLTELGVHADAEIAATLRLLLEGQITRAIVHLDRLITSVENST